MFCGLTMETIKHRASLITYQIIKPVLTFFKIMGLAPFSVHSVVSKKDSKVPLVFVSSKLGSCYNCMLTLIIIGVSYYPQPGAPRYDYTKTVEMTQCVRAILWALGNLAFNTILVSYSVKQTDLVRIGNHLIDIEWELRRLLHPTKRGSASFVIIAAFFVNGFLQFAIWITDTIAFGTGPFGRLTGRVPFFVICWFIVQYFSAVALVNAFFVDVNRALQDVSKNWSADFHPGSLRESCRVFVGSSSMQLIIELRNLHERLCQLSTEISQFYSVPILPAISYSFFRSSFMIYYLLMLLTMKETRSNPWEIIFTIYIILTLMHPVVVLSNKITNIMTQITKTGRSVHVLLNCPIDKKSKAELKQFSLQLLHYGIQFTANGYFTLDNTFVNSMAGVVFTYIALLMQFHLQAMTTTDCSCNDHKKAS